MRLWRAWVISAWLLLGLCGAIAGTAMANPKIHARPKTVHPDGSITFHGTGFQPTLTLVLYVGVPASEGERFSSVRTDLHGGFHKTLRIPHGASPGRYVVFACWLGCQRKVIGGRFRIGKLNR